MAHWKIQMISAFNLHIQEATLLLNPVIGFVAVIPVGMGYISSVNITAKKVLPWQKVTSWVILPSVVLILLYETGQIV